MSEGKNTARNGSLDVLLALAARPEGVSSREAAQALKKDRVLCVHILSDARSRGRCVSAGPHMQRRWFVDPVHAAAYEQKLEKEKQQQQEKTAAKPTHKVLNDHVFTPPVVRTHGPAHMEGEPIITNKTRIVRAAPFVDRRFEPQEVSRHVNPDECREWAKVSYK